MKVSSGELGISEKDIKVNSSSKDAKPVEQTGRQSRLSILRGFFKKVEERSKISRSRKENSDQPIEVEDILQQDNPPFFHTTRLNKIPKALAKGLITGAFAE